MAEISTKPYLIRAIYEWCADNGFTPYIAVAVTERTLVPREYVKNGEIVLNVSSQATHRLSIGNELIEFQARFGGVARDLSIPVENVSAIYARENGHGMAFDVPKALAVVENPPEQAPAPAGPRLAAVAPAAPEVAPAPAGTPFPADAGVPDPAAPPMAVITAVDRAAPQPSVSMRPAPPAAPDAAAGASPAADPATQGDDPDSPGGKGPRPRLTRVK